MAVDEDGDEYTMWIVEIGSDGYDWAVTLEDWNQDICQGRKFLSNASALLFTRSPGSLIVIRSKLALRGLNQKMGGL